MAPFVELEWGREAYELMKQVKHIFDPNNLLNPGVILNADSKIHIKNLKLFPAVNEKVDKCIECGFCEPGCVSAELTISPRQRITVFREISRLKASGEEPHIVASLINKFDYSGDATCATDGLCAIACPVNIDTGKIIKELRHDKITPRQHKTAMWIADHMSFVTSLARNALSFVGFSHSILGTGLMKVTSGGMRKLSGNKIPRWTPAMPQGAKNIRTEIKPSGSPDKVVYFPSCINRSMGKSKDYNNEDVQLTEKIQQLIRKAGFEVIFPEGMNNLCCGMAFSSKGYKEAGLKKSKELEEAFWKASNKGEYPILCDMSPCLFTMKENMEPSMKLYEPVEFILNYLIPKFEITPIEETISVFAVCSMKKMGLEDKLVQLSRMCAKEVVVLETNCCGFAGDRGFFFPELNKHGLRNIKIQIPENVTEGYSTSRTCEIGLTEHSGISFKSIVYLVDRVSTKRKEGITKRVLRRSLCAKY
jgi:D-lactate dehydrogenase